MEGIDTQHPDGLRCAVCTAAADIGDTYFWDEREFAMMVTIDLRAEDPIVTVASA